MKDLECATRAEQEEFLESFDDVFCDVDGVIWTLTQRIPGTEAAVAALRKLGKNVRFVSNNSTRRSDVYWDQLNAAGYTLDRDDLVIPTMAIIDHLKSINFEKELFVLGMSRIKEELREAGFKVAEDAPARIEESVHVLVKHIADNENVGAVIADMDINLNYMTLQKALVYLERPEVILITGASDARAPIGSNIVLLGTKYFHELLADFSGKQPYSLAKPSPNFNHFITKKFKIKDPSRVLFVGDSVPDDMGFATKCGYNKLLVLTGLTKLEMLNNWKWPEEYKPQYYVRSLEVISAIIGRLLAQKF